MIRPIAFRLTAPVLARLVLAAACVLPSRLTAQAGGPPTKVDFQGGGRGAISNSVAIPANRAYVFTSGTVPPVADTSAAAGTRARYGDTKTQAIGVLKAIEARLKVHGLTLKDVVYLRAYVVADKEKNGAFDFAGWNEAYGMFFNNPENLVKVARSTVGVAGLVNAAYLIEIEAVAVYP